MATALIATPLTGTCAEVAVFSRLRKALWIEVGDPLLCPAPPIGGRRLEERMAIFTAISRLKIWISSALIISSREPTNWGLKRAAEEGGIETTGARAIRLEAKQKGWVREDPRVRL